MPGQFRAQFRGWKFSGLNCFSTIVLTVLMEKQAKPRFWQFWEWFGGNFGDDYGNGFWGNSRTIPGQFRGQFWGWKLSGLNYSTTIVLTVLMEKQTKPLFWQFWEWFGGWFDFWGNSRTIPGQFRGWKFSGLNCSATIVLTVLMEKPAKPLMFLHRHFKDLGECLESRNHFQPWRKWFCSKIGISY